MQRPFHLAAPPRHHRLLAVRLLLQGTYDRCEAMLASEYALPSAALVAGHGQAVSSDGGHAC